MTAASDIATEIREISLEKAAGLGYSINPHLPLIANTFSRTKSEIVRRSLCLYCVVAVANNSTRKKAIGWLEQEGLLLDLTENERVWLFDSKSSSADYFAAQEEGLWALAWALSFVSILDFKSYCNESLAGFFPKVRELQPLGEFENRAKLRAPRECLQMADLAFCLHWSVREAEVRGAPLPGAVEPYVIVERRRALEWLITDQRWDAVELDT